MLTPKQEAFCREFLVDLNGTQAAIRAGYSASTARQTAAENLSKPAISERIAELQAGRARRTDIAADDVTEPNSARIRAIELLGKHVGMFVDRKQLAIKPLELWTADEIAQLLGEK